MPRARRRCANPDCKRWQPCEVHPRGWASSKTDLPRDWKSKVKAVRYRSGGRCEIIEKLGPLTRRCLRPMAAADHIVNRAEGGTNDITNLQAICAFHHKQKTQQEAARGMKKKWGKA